MKYIILLFLYFSFLIGAPNFIQPIIITVSFSVIDFGIVRKDETKSQIIKILNNGSENLILASIKLSDEQNYSIDMTNIDDQNSCGDNFPKILKPNENCSIKVIVHPKNNGDSKAILYIKSNALNNYDGKIIIKAKFVVDVPAKPLDFNISSITNHSVALRWKDVKYENSYKLYRNNKFIALLPENTTFYVDTNLVANMDYIYSLKAANLMGESNASQLTVTTYPNNTYYVSLNGDDNNDGLSPENISNGRGPWKTIQKAADTLEAGDIVYVREGTYYEKILITKSGSKEHGYITYQNYPNEKPIISRNDQDYGEDTVQGKNVSYIKFKGFTLYNCIRNALVFRDGGSHIIIQNNEIYEQNKDVPLDKRVGHALSIIATKLHPMSYILISNNILHHNHTGNPNVSGAYDEALTVLGEVEYFKISNNKVYNNDFIGIDIIGHQEGAFSVFGMNRYGIVKNNLIYNNGVRKVWASSLYVDGAVDLLVENNIIFDNKGPGIAISQETKESTTDHVIFRRNLMWNNHYNMLGSMPSSGGNVKNCVFVHNISNGSQGNESEIYFGRGEDNVIKNNIFVSTDNASYLLHELNDANTSSWIFDFNAYVPLISLNKKLVMEQKIFDSFTTYQQESGKDINSLNLELNQILFKDIDNRDYHLDIGSILIDRGDFLTKTISEGEGNVIEVEDARYFTNGWGMDEGDKIIIGSNSPVKVIDIDYENNLIKIDRNISWNFKDNVSYIYNGLKPDIGKYEYKNSGE